MIIVHNNGDFYLAERALLDNEAEVDLLDFTKIQHALAKGALDEQKYGEMLRQKLLDDGYTLAPNPATGRDFDTFLTQNALPISSPFFVYPTSVFGRFRNGIGELARYLEKLSYSRQRRKFFMFSYVFMVLPAEKVLALEAKLQSTPLGDIFAHHIETGRLGKAAGEPNEGILDFMYSTANTQFQGNGATEIGLSSGDIQSLVDIILHGNLVSR